VNTKGILGWAAVAFMIWWVVDDLARAAHVVQNIGKSLTTAAHGLSGFFASI
jgi:hypothetical protein